MKRRLWAGLIGLMLPLMACGAGTAPSAEPSTAEPSTEVTPLQVGAIPDQDPEKVQRRYQVLADYLSETLEVPVNFQPVTDYTAAVIAFKVGDLDLVWFGSLTGVQARLQVPGAEAIAQRDIDAQFHSVFIANTNSGLREITSVEGLSVLKGRSLTFGSESSTSGRLMPQHFLQQGGITLEDLKGEPGFSGNHDATIKLVEAGTYEVGALNEQVWLSRVEEGAVDLERVQVIWRTPAYYNYHWVINPQVSDRYGEDFITKVQAAFLALDPTVPEHQEILELFSAERFIETQNSNYDDIEAVGRAVGKIQ